MLSLVVHIKLNDFANAAFRFTLLVPGDPSTPAVYIPTTHFAFRPKLIGLRIGRLELFILCPAINQFLRRPNRGRKDRTATRATKRRTTSYSHGTVIKQRELWRKLSGRGRRTTRNAVAATPWYGGQLTLLGRSSDELLRRRLISSFDPMMRKTCSRRKINDFGPRYNFIGELKRERKQTMVVSFSCLLNFPCYLRHTHEHIHMIFLCFSREIDSLAVWRDILICRLRTSKPLSALERRSSMSTSVNVVGKKEMQDMHRSSICEKHIKFQTSKIKSIRKLLVRFSRIQIRDWGIYRNISIWFKIKSIDVSIR